MRIAITGGTGFIGRWFLKMFGDKYNFIVLGIEPNINELVIDEKKYKFIKTDYSYNELMKYLKSVDAVVHLAAKRYKPESQMDYYLQNILISDNLFYSCKTLGIKNIIHLSSIGVYTPELDLPWIENQNVNPLNFYTILKLTVEKIANYYNNEFSMNIKNLRLAQVLGFGERDGYMLSIFIKSAFNKKTLNIFGKGEGRREYIYVKDVINAIDCALNKQEEQGVYNIGTNKNYSHLELAKKINEVFDNKGNIQLLPNHFEDKSVYLMNIEKAEKKLNWKPLWELNEALKDIRNIMNKYGNV
ncbi:MAG: NAD(P)-dependent oxidoreductase [Bacteroidales bacterium]|nr:NAD(P)-dependent oxidoreductase [Bacteroidales bacterium]